MSGRPLRPLRLLCVLCVLPSDQTPPVGYTPAPLARYPARMSESKAPRKPTPVTDEPLAQEVRRLAGYTAQLLSEQQAANRIAELARKSLARDVAKGVFFGSLAVAVLAIGGFLLIGALATA